MLISFPEGQIRSGKSGSITFSKSGYVSPTKIHSLPKNFKNTQVQSVFQDLNTAYKKFATVLPDFITRWSDFKIIVANRVGNKITLTGKTAFIRLNMNLYFSGQPSIAFPPADLSVIGFENIKVIITALSHNLTVQLPMQPYNHSVNIFATLGYSQGMHRPDNNLFRKVGTYNYSVTSGYNIYHDYIKIFGILQHRNNISVRAQNISSGGIASAIVQTNRIIT